MLKFNNRGMNRRSISEAPKKTKYELEKKKKRKQKKLKIGIKSIPIA